MLYALICQDKPGRLQLRLDTRDDHLGWLGGLKDRGLVKMAGPFLDGDGKPDGSLIIIEAQDLEGARALAAADPYAKAGLFSAVDIRPFNWVLNNPDAR